ncbi:unnamed protein product, partial [Dibothriocephalus latus]
MISHPENHHQCAGSMSNSILATFQIEFEARRKYLTVAINSKPVCLQFDKASDISIISMRTWQWIGRPPMITSDKKAMNVSGGFLGSRSTRPSPAKSNHLTTNLMSTPPLPAKVLEKKEEEPEQKAPATSERRQTPGRSTHSSARKRRGVPTKSPSSSPTTAANSPDHSTRDLNA